MDGARHTLISIPYSLRLHSPLTVVPASHLYLGGQRKSIAWLTPHPTASGSCQYVTRTPTLTRPSRRRRVPSSTIPDVTAAPTYVYSRIFGFLSPRHPPQDLFPPLHRVSNRSFYSGTPYLHRHPTPTSDSRSYPRLTCPAIFPRLSTAILTFLEEVEPNLQRHPYVNIGFTFLSSP